MEKKMEKKVVTNKTNRRNTKLHNKRQNKSRQYDIESHDKKKMELDRRRGAH